MATKLKSYTFRGRGAHAKYDWDEWLNGSIWRLTKGDDFDTPVRTLRSAAATAASRRDMKVRTEIVDDDTLVLQAYST